MSRCPSGHESASDDYCDVCGLPITDSGEAAPAADPGASAAEPPAPAGVDDAGSGGSGGSGGADSGLCPNCQAANPANALFCEACGFDFTTGTAPRAPTPTSALDLGAPLDPPTSERPAVDAGLDLTASPSTPSASEPPASVAPPLAESWVAEVWIDPDWYADQDSDDPLPSAGLPTVTPLRTTSILVGRASRSRNIHPDIDLGTDSGISRRHCQFTTDGKRWWVEDLGSSNGTYVGGPVGPLPSDPVRPGDKREILPDERIYLGAWTRIVIRKATPGEV